MAISKSEEFLHKFVTPEKLPEPKPNMKFIDAPEKSSSVKAKPAIIGYVKDAKEVTGDEINHAFAKKIVNDRNERTFFIRRGTTTNRLLDPWGQLYRLGDENRNDRLTGKRLYEFTQVSEHCFNTYLKYLQTQSNKYLNIAQREMVVGNIV